MHFAAKPVLQFICDYLHDQCYLCATFLSVHNKSEICTGKIVYCFSITSLIEQKDRSQFPIYSLTPARIAFDTRRMRALHICGFATLFSTIAFAKPRLHIPRMLPTSICKSYFCHLYTDIVYIRQRDLSRKHELPSFHLLAQFTPPAPTKFMGHCFASQIHSTRHD